MLLMLIFPQYLKEDKVILLKEDTGFMQLDSVKNDKLLQL